MTRKVISLLTVGALAVLLTVGCSGNNNQPSADPEAAPSAADTSPSADTSQPAEPPVLENIIITMEHQDTEKPERIAFYDRAAAKYTEMHPNVKIEITTASFTDAQKTILTALSAGEPFDIFGASVGDAGLWLERDAVLDLTPYFEADGGEWKNTFRDGVIQAITYGDGRIYNVPTYLDSAPLLYHKDKLEEINGTPAANKEEFFALLEAFKQAGYEASFQVHTSLKDDLLAIIALQFAAKYNVNPFDIVSKKAPFTDPWFTDALTVFKEMYDAGYLPKNLWTIGGTEGRLSYASGQIPMRFGFFWDVDTHKDMGMPYENQGVASFPNLTGSDVKVYKPVGIGAFMVSKTTEHPDQVIDFLKFLTNAENQDDMAFKYFGRYPNGMPVVNKAVELSEYAKLYMDDIASGIGTPFAPYNVSLKFEEVISSNLPLYLQGSMTLEQIAAEFDKLRSE